MPSEETLRPEDVPYGGFMLPEGADLFSPMTPEEFEQFLQEGEKHARAVQPKEDQDSK